MIERSRGPDEQTDDGQRRAQAAMPHAVDVTAAAPNSQWTQAVSVLGERWSAIAGPGTGNAALAELFGGLHNAADLSAMTDVLDEIASEGAPEALAGAGAGGQQASLPAAPGASGAAAPPAADQPPTSAPGDTGPVEAVAETATVDVPVAGEASRSPADDPEFVAVAERIAGVAGQQRAHVPATSAVGSAQHAAPAPANDVTAQAAGRQAQRMEQTPTPGFDRIAFKARLTEQIDAAAPKDPKEAKGFAKNNRLGEAKQAMTGEVARAGDAAHGGLKQQTQQAPDTAGLQPKPVGTLDVPQRGAAPGGVPATGAAPKPRDDASVAGPFEQRNAELDGQLVNADVTEEQLTRSNEPTFTGALSAKRDAIATGMQAPQTYRADESGTISQAQAGAEVVAQDGTTQMHEQRSGLLDQVAGAQQQTMDADHGRRAQVAADIEAIYEQTRQRLADRLTQMDADVDRVFDGGAEAARTAFESYVEDKIDDRYSGLRGKGRWLKDKVLSWGLAEPVKRIFEEGRARYVAQMDTVIDQVVDVVEAGITDARAIVAGGRAQIAIYVEQLPADLRDVGQQAANDIGSRFDELEASIDAKQTELVDSLARRYTEQVAALDARIEELESEHASFASRAYNAVKGVVEAILRLKDMLLSVLARAAEAIGGIIRDPIGFLGNMVDGVKAGLDNFIGKIWDHLSAALQQWLFGALSGAGIDLPEQFDEAGILDLVMQVLGMTYQNIRARAVGIVGEDVVAKLEQFAEPFIVLIREGPGGLWDWIKEQLSNLKDMVLDEIQDWVITKIIKAGILWIISLLNPAAAFIKACKAIYDIVMFFIRRASDLAEMVNAIVESISAVARGSVGGVATKVENALARTLPVVIGFLASLLGLGGISDKIRAVIDKLKTPIDNAVDWVIEKSVTLVRGAGRLFGVGTDTDLAVDPDATPATTGPIDGVDPDHDAAVGQGLADIPRVETQHATNGLISRSDAEKVAGKVAADNPVFSRLVVVDGGDSWNYEWAASPGDEIDTPTEKLEDHLDVVGRNVQESGIDERLTAAGYRAPYLRQGRWIIARVSTDSGLPLLRVDDDEMIRRAAEVEQAELGEIFVDLDALLDNYTSHPHLELFAFDPRDEVSVFKGSMRREALRAFRPRSTDQMRKVILEDFEETGLAHCAMSQSLITDFTDQLTSEYSEHGGSVRWVWPGGWEVHHVLPTYWGGHDRAYNYAAIPFQIHDEITAWWERLQQRILEDADAQASRQDAGSGHYAELHFE